MLVNGLDMIGAIAAPGYCAEYLLLQVWASPYRFMNDREIMEFRSYNSINFAPFGRRTRAIARAGYQWALWR